MFVPTNPEVGLTWFWRFGGPGLRTCGARTRAGGACRGPAMANGRCRFHGGKSTGPRPAPVDKLTPRQLRARDFRAKVERALRDRAAAAQEDGPRLPPDVARALHQMHGEVLDDVAWLQLARAWEGTRGDWRFNEIADGILADAAHRRDARERRL